MQVKSLKSRVRLKSGNKKDDRAKPVAPSLEYAQPEPLSPKPRQDAATDQANRDVENVSEAIQKVDPRKVADRVYELMKNEIKDGRARGGHGNR